MKKHQTPLRGLSDEQLNFLDAYLLKEGLSSRNKAVLTLINEKMASESEITYPVNANKNAIINSKKKSKKRIQISLRENDYMKLVSICNNTDTSPINYIIRVILSSIYSENIKLLGVEIEQLKKSNYELHKIGVNINQIAKAINSGENINFDLSILNDHISSHLEIVQMLLKSSLEKY